MRFRKFLLKSRLWWRCTVSKRHHKRLLRQLATQTAEYTQKLDAQRRYYEKRLAVEQLKVESLNLAWCDRLLQSQKLLTISQVTYGLDEKADNVLEPVPSKSIEPETDLNADQMDFFLDAKDGFWEIEASNGRTETEIAHLWNTQYKQLEIARAKSSVY